MDNKLKLREIVNNISNGNGSPVEKYLLKKLGQDKGLEFVKFISAHQLHVGNILVDLEKITDEKEQTNNKYTIQLFDKKGKQVGRLNYNIHTDDPRYIRVSFKELHNKDDLETLDLMLKFIDEIAMKVEAKVVDAPYPLKSEQSIYRQHKYEPFSSHATGSDRMYNKYDIKHCKTNLLGLIDEENEKD